MIDDIIETMKNEIIPSGIFLNNVNMVNVYSQSLYQKTARSGFPDSQILDNMTDVETTIIISLYKIHWHHPTSNEWKRALMLHF